MTRDVARDVPDHLRTAMDSTVDRLERLVLGKHLWRRPVAEELAEPIPEVRRCRLTSA